MTTPAVYYGNLLLSGTLSGSNNTTTNPARRVADGSVNLSYTMTRDVSASLNSGQVQVVLTSAQVPDALSIPRMSVPSGFTLELQSAPSEFASGTVVLSKAFSGAEATSYRADLPGGTSSALVWRVILSGASGLVSPKVHEVQLATKQDFPRAVEVGVQRQHVRQFTRIPVPGGQPFVKRDGPKLRRYQYRFRTISSQEASDFRDLVQALEGGDAFTFVDDLGDAYWAEMPEATVPEDDEGGVSTWSVVAQEIKVD